MIAPSSTSPLTRGCSRPGRGGRLPCSLGRSLRPTRFSPSFARAEARDFVDLLAVEPLYGLYRFCRLAAEKDRGFAPVIFAEMLGRFGRLRRDEFELDNVRYEQLAHEVDGGRACARSRAWTRAGFRSRPRSLITKPGWTRSNASNAAGRVRGVPPPVPLRAEEKND